MLPHPLRLAKDPFSEKLPFRVGYRIPAQRRKILLADHVTVSAGGGGVLFGLLAPKRNRRLFPVSATHKLPAASQATARGLDIEDAETPVEFAVNVLKSGWPYTASG